MLQALADSAPNGPAGPPDTGPIPLKLRSAQTSWLVPADLGTGTGTAEPENRLNFPASGETLLARHLGSHRPGWPWEVRRRS